jgi:hypothetical protein
MNKELFFKIGGVKDLKSFYAKFKDEESFMRAHGKEFKKAQLGEKIKKAGFGDYIPNILSATETAAGTFPIQQPQLAKVTPQQPTQEGLNAFNKMIGKPNLASGIPILGDVVKGFQQLKDERNKLKKTKQWKGVSDVQLQASQTTDVDANKQDNLLQRAFYNNVNTGEGYFPVFGVGDKGIGGYAKNGGEMHIPSYQDGGSLDSLMIDGKFDVNKFLSGINFNVSDTRAATFDQYNKPIETVGKDNPYKKTNLWTSERGYNPYINRSITYNPNLSDKADTTYTLKFGNKTGYTLNGKPLNNNTPMTFKRGSSGDEEFDAITKYFNKAESITEKDQYRKNGGKIAANGSFMNGFRNFASGIDSNKLNNLAVGISGGDSAGATLGGAAGDAISMIPGVGPIVSKFAKPVLSAVGNLLDTNPEKIKKYQDATDRNIGKMALGEGMQNVFNQNNAYMEDGGYLSNDWTPQVITKFGEHRVSDLLRKDPMMDTLRTGGRLQQNNVEDLQLYEGGAQQVSPDMIKFNGPSHADGGMNIAYGNNPVEVEGGEYATEVPNGNGEKSLVVLGNLQNPLTGHKFKRDGAILAKKTATEDSKLKRAVEKIGGIDMINSFDKISFDSLKIMADASSKKLQKYDEQKNDYIAMQQAINDTAEEHGLVADDLAVGKIKRAKNGGKFTAEDGKTIEDRMKMVLGPSTFGLDKSTNPSRPTYMYPYNDPRVPLGTLSPENTIYNLTQSMIPDYNYLPQEHNNETSSPEPTLLPEVTIPYNRSSVKNTGKGKPVTKEALSNIIDLAKWIAERESWEQGADPMDAQRIANSRSNVVSKIGETTKTSTTDKTKDKSKFPWYEMINSLVPYLRPSDTERLDPRQILGELSALSDKEEPVQASLYHPQLSTPYSVVLPGKEDIIAQTRAAQKLSGYNPAAQAMIAAQSYSPLAELSGKEFMINQEQANKTYAQNRDITNQAQLQNLQILDNQYTRQAQAKSNTKATLRAALSSISSKYMQNQYENRDLALRENLYNYRFDDRGRKQNWNQPMEWNMEGSGYGSGRGSVSGIPDDWMTLYDQYGTFQGTKKKTAADKKSTTVKSKNGGLVRAIHNL